MYMKSCGQQHRLKPPCSLDVCGATTPMVFSLMVCVITKCTFAYYPKNIFICLQSTFGSPYLMADGITSFPISLLIGNSPRQYTEYYNSAFSLFWRWFCRASIGRYNDLSTSQFVLNARWNPDTCQHHICAIEWVLWVFTESWTIYLHCMMLYKIHVIRKILVPRLFLGNIIYLQDLYMVGLKRNW